ncbi:hypothetical protein BJV74DRAFT_603839 [Russula compacta]|nr:hypothetical protein BJV74DRAFT_603839 [Russula compacta]
MKSILRRKTPTDHVQRPSPPSSVSNIRQSSTVETPLYARFASTKQAVQPQERSRIVVSGPMPLGRPNRANLEADDSRRKREDATVPRHKLSNGRQGTPPGPQSLRNSFSGSRGVQSSLDGSYQDARVNLAQAARPPIKVQAPSSSDEQLATSIPHSTTATESVQYLRDVPPSPPLSPQLSPYSQQVVPTTVNQFPPSSLPSVRKSHTTATNIPAIPTRLYPEPRYPTSRSSENRPSMDAPISGITKIISTEPGPRGPSNHLPATGFPRSPNQASFSHSSFLVP